MKRNILFTFLLIFSVLFCGSFQASESIFFNKSIFNAQDENLSNNFFYYNGEVVNSVDISLKSSSPLSFDSIEVFCYVDEVIPFQNWSFDSTVISLSSYSYNSNKREYSLTIQGKGEGQTILSVLYNNELYALNINVLQCIYELDTYDYYGSPNSELIIKPLDYYHLEDSFEVKFAVDSESNVLIESPSFNYETGEILMYLENEGSASISCTITYNGIVFKSFALQVYCYEFTFHYFLYDDTQYINNDELSIIANNGIYRISLFYDQNNNLLANHDILNYISFDLFGFNDDQLSIINVSSNNSLDVIYIDLFPSSKTIDDEEGYLLVSLIENIDISIRLNISIEENQNSNLITVDPKLYAKENNIFYINSSIDYIFSKLNEYILRDDSDELYFSSVETSTIGKKYIIVTVVDSSSSIFVSDLIEIYITLDEKRAIENQQLLTQDTMIYLYKDYFINNYEKGNFDNPLNVVYKTKDELYDFFESEFLLFDEKSIAKLIDDNNFVWIYKKFITEFKFDKSFLGRYINIELPFSRFIPSIVIISVSIGVVVISLTFGIYFIKRRNR